MRRLLALVALLAVSPLARPADPCSQAYADRGATAAFSKCRRAAKSGNAESQFGYGLVLWSGKGRSASQAEALEWLRRSARQAHLLARITLGRFLTSEDLAPELRNRAEGYAWWVLAGEKDAASNLKGRLSSTELVEGESLVTEFLREYGASR